MPFGRVFETLAWGRRHVVMGANQIDRFGNQNLSAFGPLQQPTRQMFGVRGAPGNTINHATSYWVGNHSKRVFCDQVDIVSGIGYDKMDPGQPGLPVRQRLPGGEQSGRVRLRRSRPHHAGAVPAPRRRTRRCRARTPPSRSTASTRPTRTRLPTDDELRLIRERASTRSGCGTRKYTGMKRLRTPLTELVGIEHPVVQTGMGWVAGARLVAATSNAGGLGILASATMTLDELAVADREGQGGDRQAVRREHPRRRRRRRRPGRADDPRGREGGVIRAGAQAGTDRAAERGRRRWSFRRSARPSMPGRSPAGVPTRSSFRAVRAAGTPDRSPPPCCCPRCWTRSDIPVIAAGGFFDGRGLAAALSYGAAGVAMGTRFLLTSDSTVPDAVKQRYLEAGLDGTVVSTRVDGMPHRVLRTGLVEKLESGSRVRGFTAAVRNAASSRRCRG